MNLIPNRVRELSGALAGVALLLAACGGEAATAEQTGAATATGTAAVDATAVVEATATSEVTPGETTRGDVVSVAREAPDAGRVMDHIEVLAVEIGSRPAGTEAEREAAAYIEGEFAEAGYETAIEPFTARTRLDNSAAVTADGETVRPYMMNGSASGEATGRLVYGGLGSAADLEGLDLEGAVVLLDRGVLPFEEKARNAQSAGAVGVLIANNEAGPYGGSLGGWIARIPVVSIRREEGELLRPLAEPTRAEGVALTLRAAVEQIVVESQNVVGRAGSTCEVYLGAHYDSVPEGPGANDNASGTALLIEIARVQRTDGLCVVAFGAEEIGLFGSRAFVDEHEVSEARWMLNFDMVGRLDGPIIVGDAALTEVILDAVAAGPQAIEAGSFPPFASSDHVSFADAGVPAVTFNSGDDAAIHTPDDALGRVSVEAVEAFLGVVELALTELLGT